MKNGQESTSGDDSTQDQPSSHDAELIHVLEAYQDDLEAGRAVSGDELISAHPELADELRAYLRVMGLAHRMAGRLHGDPFSREGQSTLTAAAAELTPDLAAVLAAYSNPAVPAGSNAIETSPDAGTVGTCAGRYRLLQEVGRGGMGVVFRARDDRLGRELAIKLIRGSQTVDPTLVRRFLEEAQIEGQLQHPGIVPVYDVGKVDNRRPFFAMKLIDGQTLARLIADHADPARLLGVFRQVCETIAYAHSRGVIHRDLKPSNVMVGDFGEVLIMDWGLAKVLCGAPAASAEDPHGANTPRIETARSGSDSAVSQPGSVIGTPAYMAPEQARGEHDQLDSRTDVFSLGATLCEVLTGKPPYTGASAQEIRQKAAAAELGDAMSRLDASGADGELVAIAKSCLAVIPADRPRDGAAVAEAVSAHLSHVQQRLRDAELAHAEAEARATEEHKRRRVEVGLVASLAGLVVLIAGGLAFEAHRRGVQQAETYRSVDEVLDKVAALRSRAEAEAEGGLAGWDAVLAQMAVADDLLRQGRPDAALRAKVLALRADLERAQTQTRAEAAQVARDRELIGRLETIRGQRAEHWDDARTAADYAAAFQHYGLNFDQTDPMEVGARIARRPAAIEIAEALVDWALRRLNSPAPGPEASWRRLIAAAQAVDPDPWRNSLRDQIGRNDLAALRRLAEDKSLATQPAPSIVLLDSALRNKGDFEHAAALLRACWLKHPDDFWINFDLGLAAEGLNLTEESVRHYMTATAIRPRSFAALTNLAAAQHAQNRMDAATATLSEALRLNPESFRAHNTLGDIFRHEGKREAALAEFRAALRLKPDYAAAHNNLGLLLMERGNGDAAIAELREAIRLDPRLPGVHTNLGTALREQGKLEAAIAELREAIRLDPNLAKFRSHIGDLLNSLGKNDEAAVEYRKAIELVPDAPETHNNLGVVLTRQRKHDEATAELRKALQLKPNFIDAHCNLGNELRLQGKRAEAVAEYREAIRLRPGSAAFHANLGIVFRELRRLDEANAEYRVALRLEPGSAQWHTDLGVVLSEQHKLDEASAEFRTAIRLMPDYAPAHNSLGLVFRGQGRLDEASAEFRTAIRLKPDLAMAHNNLGITLSEQGKVEEAITEYRVALRIEPNLTEIRSNLGRTLQRQGKVDEAIAEYQEAVRLKPEAAVGHLSLGIALGQRGRQEEAIAEFHRAIRLDPNSALAHNNLGIALVNQGKPVEAVAAFREAIRLNPGYTEAHNNLGSILFSRQELAAAIDEYRTALQLEPQSAGIHSNLGTALVSQGKLAAAIDEFRTAIRLQPQYYGVYINLGNALKAEKDLAGAIEAYRQAIGVQPNVAIAHANLGEVLAAQGDVKQAAMELRRAVDLKPDSPEARGNLGICLRLNGDVTGAIRECREAIRLRPDHLGAHNELGVCLALRGDLDGAIAEMRQAIALKPDSYEVHYNLASTLGSKGDLAGAIAEFREAIRLQPDDPDSYCRLGLTLEKTGDYAGALAALERGHELGSRRPGWRRPSAQWLKDAQRMAALNSRLPAVLKGADAPRDIAENLAFAQLCYDRGKHSSAARFWSAALAAEPKLGDDRQTQLRYNAACSAALAAAGSGKDENPLDAAARSRLRGQALDWLSYELKVWSKLVASGPPQTRPFIVQTLQHWKVDTDLASVRDPDALARLTEPERKDWQALWAHVDELLIHSQAGSTPKPAPSAGELPPNPFA